MQLRELGMFEITYLCKWIQFDALKGHHSKNGKSIFILEFGYETVNSVSDKTTDIVPVLACKKSLFCLCVFMCIYMLPLCKTELMISADLEEM